MFYEIKEKRYESASQTRWWLTAALSAIIITASFVGITFWLGMTSNNRQQEIIYPERHPSSFRDYEFRSSSSSSSLESPKYDDYVPPSPAVNNHPVVPVAEILKTTIKSKKAKIEMVDIVDNGLTGDSSSLRPITFNTPRNPITEPTIIVSSSTGNKGTTNIASTTSANTASTTNDSISNTMPSNGGKPDEVSATSKKQSVSQHNRYSLYEGISPLTEESAFTLTEEDLGSSIKKKSEAIPPSWYDPNLPEERPVEISLPSTPGGIRQRVNDASPDNIYDIISDFSSIKPDLSTFNVKTIPAFTYLKEPLPQFESLHQKQHSSSLSSSSSSSSSASENSDEYAYYYRQQQQQQQPEHRDIVDDSSIINNNNNNRRNVPISSQNEDDSDNNVNEDDKTTQSFSTFIKRRMRDFHEWILRTSNRNRADLSYVLKTINATVFSKGANAFYGKLREFYDKLNTTEFQNIPVANFLYPSGGASNSIFNNTNSIMSFGLLAIDLFLLHNVQQMVWNEESKLAEEMLKDPDVSALNALFLSPDKVKRLKDHTNSRIFNSSDSTTNRDTGKGILHELIEFVNGGLRAVLNLSKAYKSSTTNQRARSTTADGGLGSNSNGGTTIDCIWTLYCRNLDKTAKLRGPYGFLAKMNSLGLRLMMGEFPADKAFEKLTKEYNSGWGVLNCDKLFPRCNADEAKEVVIQTALGQQTPSS